MISRTFKKSTEYLCVMLIVSICAYALIGLMPGDPVYMIVAGNPDATAADIERLKEIFDLDRPLHERYIGWISGVLQGEAGYSRLYGQPVMDIIGPAFLRTLILLGGSLFLSFLIALPLGILAARNEGRTPDHAINSLAYAGISVPPFWLALMLIIIFAVALGWLPSGGMSAQGSSFFESLKFYILPVISLTLATVGGYIRHIRSAFVDVMHKPHIRTAKAKGVAPIRIIFQHILPSAMIPVITILALDFGTLFSGALITETVFNWQGMGKTIFDAIMGNDFNLALMGLMLSTVMILLANFVADLIYPLLDPRLRRTEER